MNAGWHVIYENEARSKCLQRCGWIEINDATGLEVLCRSLEDEGKQAKSAMMALFHFNFSRALTALEKNQDSPLASVLSTISGIQPQQQMKQLCLRMSEHVTDNYSAAALIFLAGNEHLHRILPLLNTSDRIGFACRFLSDSELTKFLESELERGKEQGDLDVMLISGLTERGIDILSKYLSKTGDIQTVALLSALQCEDSINARTENWIEQYRETLNQLQLWYARCRFDIEKGTRSKETKNKSIRCYYCGSSLALPDMMKALSVKKRGMSQFEPKGYTNYCPECMRSFPKCAVCLMPFNSINPYKELARSRKTHNTPAPIVKFDEWFSWCEQCRHGGHAGHLLEWFQNSSECPVAGCSCHCTSID